MYADERRDINLTPDYYGHGADGGFAEYIAVPSDQFYTVPNPELADAELAAMGMCSYQTAVHMLNAAHVRAGERVLDWRERWCRYGIDPALPGDGSDSICPQQAGQGGCIARTRC